MRTQAAASRRATMPLLALNRKDTGWRIDWQIRPLGHRFSQRHRKFSQRHRKTLALWRYRGRGGCAQAPAHAIVVKSAASHGLVIRPAAAFRGNPGNVAIGVLHVAGFAVDAV